MNELKRTIDQLKLSDRYAIVISNLWNSCVVRNLNRTVESVLAITVAVWKGERTWLIQLAYSSLRLQHVLIGRNKAG